MTLLCVCTVPIPGGSSASPESSVTAHHLESRVSPDLRGIVLLCKNGSQIGPNMHDGDLIFVRY